MAHKRPTMGQKFTKKSDKRLALGGHAKQTCGNSGIFQSPAVCFPTPAA
jgi:hypothetical protein